MKTYYIYNIQNDAFLGEVKADNIDAAEFKAFELFIDNYEVSTDIVAFSEKL